MMLVVVFIDNQVIGSIFVFCCLFFDIVLLMLDVMDLVFYDYWFGVCVLVGNGVVVFFEFVQDYIQYSGNVIGEECCCMVVDCLCVLVGCFGGGVGSGLDYFSVYCWRWCVNMVMILFLCQDGVDVWGFVMVVVVDRMLFVFLCGVGGEILLCCVFFLWVFGLFVGVWWLLCFCGVDVGRVEVVRKLIVFEQGCVGVYW